MSLLDKIDGPADVRRLEPDQLPELATEVRERMVDVISKVGGHFAPGLGVVELTIALHHTFDTPRDRIVWDVGHQGYPHKILTGRNAAFDRIRQQGGPSGFLSRKESEHDAFGAGHAATSISAAYGMATARDLTGADFKVVAVIGDGALTSGIAYEAMNNAGNSERDLVVVLNDNEMSIAPNVGSISKYLSRVVTNPVYNRMREEIKNLIHRAPSAIGDVVEGIVVRLEESAKTLLTPGILFEELGFRYVGPVDGHDLPRLLDTFREVRRWKGPTLVHVRTVKGKGYALAEENPVVWHGAKPFDKISGTMAKKKDALPAYTSAFGKALVELGATHPEMAVITAAMPDGTGTGAFAEAYPERFFDVGIAEGHGITFAAGLATAGVRPVAAIYSTFLQRAYDSIIHDAAIQELPMILAMDRAGLVGNDGPTHMGLYDIAYLLAVPNTVVTAPKDGAELQALLRLGMEAELHGPYAVRYPRDSVPAVVPPLADIPPVAFGTWEELRRGQDVAVLAVGTMVLPALDAARALEAEGLDVTVVNARFLKPMDEAMLADIPPVAFGTWEELRRGQDVAVLAVGTMVLPALDAARALEAEGLDVTVVNARFLKPMDEAMLADVVARHGVVVTVEEGTMVNGFGAAVARRVAEVADGVPPRVEVIGVPDRIIEHASRGQQLAALEMDAPGLARRIEAAARRGRTPVRRETA